MLCLADGEFVVFVGPWAAANPPCCAWLPGSVDGELQIDGERVNELPPMDRSVGMVFQSYALYPHMSVAENMAFGLKLAKDGSQVNEGDALILGVRPEHFVEVERADFVFQGQVAVAERLGDHDLLHLDLEGLDTTVTVCSDGNRRVAVGDHHAVGILADKCHLFRVDGEACARHYREPALFG